MKVFVINLERSITRRTSMQQQLSKQNIDFEFIKAVDGATLTDEYLAQVCDFKELAERPHLQHKGMYGCILSHYHIYERMVAENLPFAVVLEDDILIEADLKPMLQELVTKLKANEAILLFSQNHYMPTVFSEQQQERLPNQYRLSYPIEAWSLASTAGYIISLEAARAMLKLVLPIRHAPDAWGHFYESRAIRSLRCVTPFLVKPAGFKSDIDYVPNTSFLGKALTFINDHEIFPIKQLLDYRRRRVLNKTAHYSFTQAPSPVASGVVAAPVSIAADTEIKASA